MQSWLNSPCKWGKTGYLNIVVISAILIQNVFFRKKKKLLIKLAVLFAERHTVEVLRPAQLSATELVGVQSLFYSYAHTISLSLSLSVPSHFQRIIISRRRTVYNLFSPKYSSMLNEYSCLSLYGTSWDFYLVGKIVPYRIGDKSSFEIAVKFA